MTSFWQCMWAVALRVTSRPRSLRRDHAFFMPFCSLNVVDKQSLGGSEVPRWKETRSQIAQRRQSSFDLKFPPWIVTWTKKKYFYSFSTDTFWSLFVTMDKPPFYRFQDNDDSHHDHDGKQKCFKDSTTQHFCRAGDTFSGDTPVGFFYSTMKIVMKPQDSYFRLQNI